MSKVLVVIPVYNEEQTLVEKVTVADRFMKSRLPDSHIVIADNASTDRTAELARDLSRGSSRIQYHYIPVKGKGSAIKRTWLDREGYDIYAFMDVDLSTDLAALPALVQAVEEGYDLAIGSRYVIGAYTVRSWKREFISFCYRVLFSALFQTGIKDPQCGFKAVNTKVREKVLPRVETDGFFFDTELLIRAWAMGFKIKEVPIVWTEDPDSTVNFLRDVPDFLRGLARLKLYHARGKLNPRQGGEE